MNRSGVARSPRYGRRDPRRGQQGSRARRALLPAVAAGSVLVVLAAGSVQWLTDYAVSRVERVAAFRGLTDRPPGSPGTNLLIVGSDRRSGMSEQMRRKLHLGNEAGRRSDTMILAHVSPEHGSAVLVSLPRDWYVEIPAHRDDGERVPAARNKLNAAYAFGGGPLAVATVEHNTGVRVDHYVEVNFLGFVDIVDALGGVTVCMPRAVDDPDSGLALPAGTSDIGGVQALAYVRARKTLGTGSDLERIGRQQQFLDAMLRRASSTGTLLNPVKFTNFMHASLRALRLDRRFSAADLRRLLLAVRDLDRSRVAFRTVPIADASVQTENAGLAAVADQRKAAALFTRIREDDFALRGAGIGRQPDGEPENQQGQQGQQGPGAGESGNGPPVVDIPPGRIAIEVYNGTRTRGLGRRANRDLREAGFVIEQAPRSADPPLDARTTVIQHGPSRADSARTLRASIPGARLKEIPALGADIQVVVGSGYDGTRPVRVRAGNPGPSRAGGAQGDGGRGRCR